MATAGEIGAIVLTALWLFLPAFLANMAPVFVGGPPPIDGGRVWRDGRRILGDGKTWRGLFLGPLVASAIVLGLSVVPPSEAGRAAGLVGWGSAAETFVFAYVIGFGALVGDAVKSFFKRRSGRDRGARWPGFDQLDFVAGGLLFAAAASALWGLAGGNGAWFSERFTLERIVALVILTPGLHLLVNIVGYKLGKKDVPW
ncbi:MAG TPA: CDP-2,3-bis-(O-geranylgeranyl)-sn-glycerol synthase [Candidatus Thermoplasmatota archaeon]|nr:CDP-2,3-bis-(O-geranylgeranyl)-sn-glycerol synthase [Candidatus Thermoplasmatota archaeon]